MMTKIILNTVCNNIVVGTLIKNKLQMLNMRD